MSGRKPSDTTTSDTQKLDIEVTYDLEGRVRVRLPRGEDLEGLTRKKLASEKCFTVDPMTVRGCTMQPTELGKCPPLMLKLGWKNMALDVIEVRRETGEEQRSTAAARPKAKPRKPEVNP